MKYRIDLHTHSKQSPDGSIDEKDYRSILQSGKLQAVAITDHNTIEYAKYCQKKLGKQIIVGEEISTQQGHLIGLYLKREISPHQDAVQTANEIKQQGGIVYVPHAYDIFRHGISEKQLGRILQLIDILEICNGRMLFQYFNYQAKKFAQTNNILKGYGSDAHTAKSMGCGALLLSQPPTNNLSSFQHGTIDNTEGSVFRFFGPKMNRLQKIFFK